MTRRSGKRRVSAGALIVGCFVASGVVRLADPAGPVAQAATALASNAAHAPPPDRTASRQCDEDVDASALLDAVYERETQLRNRALEIADRERVLEAAESRMREERERLEVTRKRLEKTLSIADDAAEADIQRLVAVYESMDPKKSSKIFETMDVGFAAGFLARMRQDVAAEVLGGMPAERAYAISATIAGRNATAPKN
jgi:flagellar motility protein MotE (MotC chaperone)